MRLSAAVPELTRQDIWVLEEAQTWHPVTEAYALAIGELKSRPTQETSSWAYQAAIHAVPPGQHGDNFRDQCQHGSWFFLPWHRMYLYYMERLARAVIAGRSDVSDEVKESWALPYWNYGRGGKYASLPPAFREPVHNGAPNPLFVRERNPVINRGGRVPNQAASWTTARLKQIFAVVATPGQSAGFGGPVTGWNHNPSEAYGALEQTPHNDVHGYVGGQGGFMSAFDTAPLDPAFWLHHCNLDRLWSVWLSLPGRLDPTQAAWLDMQFYFHDETGQPAVSQPRQVVDTRALGYVYATPPVHAAIAAVVAPTAEQLVAAGIEPIEGAPPADSFPPGPPPPHPPEPVGASDGPFELAGAATRVSFALQEPQSPPVTATAEVQQRAYLSVDGISGSQNPGISYGVYLNLPTGAAEQSNDAYVGNLSFFGIERVGDTNQDHGSHGLRHVFNASQVMARQREAGTWRDNELTVTFAPIHLLTESGETQQQADVATVTIGSVSLFRQ